MHRETVQTDLTEFECTYGILLRGIRQMHIADVSELFEFFLQLHACVQLFVSYSHAFCFSDMSDMIVFNMLFLRLHESTKSLAFAIKVRE